MEKIYIVFFFFNLQIVIQIVHSPRIFKKKKKKGKVSTSVKKIKS